MNALIPVGYATIGKDRVQAVEGRALHEYLGIVRDFNAWMDVQIERARLVPGRDYLTYAQVVQVPSGSKTRKETTLTLDAAKHIAMLSASDKGFEVRDYFIECERRALAQLQAPKPPSFQIPTTLSGALRLAAEQAEQIEQQAQALALAAPKVEFVDRYTVADSGSKGFRQVCKLLGAKENDFRAFLNARQIMYRLNGDLTPYAQHVDAGRFEVKTGEAHGHAFSRALFTPKGVTWVAGEWAKWQLVANQEAA